MKFTDFSGMARRQSWVPDPKVERQDVDWKSLLTLDEVYCVVGNQMISHVQTIGTKWPELHVLGAENTKNEGLHLTSGEVSPGLECVEFYPLAKGNVYGGEFDVFPSVISFYSEDGKHIKLVNNVQKRRWRPDLQFDVFEAEGIKLQQTISCSDDVMVCKITPIDGVMPEYLEINCDFGNTKGIMQAEFTDDGQTFIWGQETKWSNTVFSLWCNKNLDVIEISQPEDPIRYRLKGTCGNEVIIAFSVTYLMDDLKERMKRNVKDPEMIFAKATAFWDEYFTRMVPTFQCSDTAYVRQYYYTFFCLRANVWDIPFEPLLYPYTCTSKLIWKWSWPWNSIFDNVTLRWLNDKTLAEGNVLQQFYLGRSMLEDPVDKEFVDLVPREERNEFPIAYGGLSVNTTIYDAIWMTFLVTGNLEWIRKLYPAIQKHYIDLSAHCNEVGLAGWGVDEWDNTARKEFNPDTMVDTSCFLLSCTYSLMFMATELHISSDAEMYRKAAQTIKDNIQNLLWDKDRNIFVDTNIKDNIFSPLKTAASFDPLYCEAATEDQAKWLLQHLTDPTQFWTPYPIPALSIDSPEFKADGEGIGNGPIPPISCGWFQIEGLVKYGYDETAAELIHRQMEMNTLSGVSSAVKFNPLTGEGLQFFVSRKESHSLCTMNATIVDLVIRYIVGFQPRADEIIEFYPLALKESWDHVSWGPYLYCDKEIEFTWNHKEGMTIRCQDTSINFPKLSHVKLNYLDNKLISV